ncbi:MAG: tetratricopeptide repeat protein [Candidatus Adiutrix sp.]|jgi:hypothetical protein|nr:tetratricopeptide repeat protein [Candidatus Adiutrix sp.]
MSEQLKKIEDLFAQGRPQEALDGLEEFLQTEPDNVRALSDLGAIRQALGQGEEAIAAFQKAAALAPDNQTAGTNLALALIAARKWPAAREQLNRLLAQNQNEARLWALLAKTEQALGNRPAAVEFIDRSLNLNPEQPDLKEARLMLERQADRPAAQAAGQVGWKPSVLMCCQASLENFALDLCDELDKTAVVKRLVADNFGPFQWPIKSAGIVWLEWGSEMAIAATNEIGLLEGKKVILRLHSFEILSDLAERINYGAVTDLVFVSNFMRELFMRKLAGRLNKTRVHVIHNGIHLNRFPFVPGRGRKKIAFAAKLDYKKDPMLMMHAFHFLHKRHPELELHVAGSPDANRHYLAIPDMARKNGLGPEVVSFYGHVRNMPAWYADKDFILCASPFESQGVGLLEAMHRGLRPLIYNFPGAEHLYPASYLWNNLDELEELLQNGPEPEECRRFVAEKYSMERQAASFMKVISGTEEVTEEPPVLVSGGADSSR